MCNCGGNIEMADVRTNFNVKVSIIMGIYNCAATLPAAVESILEQTYDNWELIMCDDGSDDNSYEVAQNIAKRFPEKIILLKNEYNMRLAATLNRCLKYARGEYVARMDADDISMADRLETQIKFLENNPEYACVGSNMIIFDEKGEHGERVMPEKTKKATLLKTTIFSHPTIMMKRSVYQKLGGYTVSKSTMRAEDLDLWFRFVHAGYKGYNIQRPLYKYRESEKDLKKRSLRVAFQTSKVFLNGYKLLGFSKIQYVYAFRPIIVALLPDRLICKYHTGTQVIQ